MVLHLFLYLLAFSNPSRVIGNIYNVPKSEISEVTMTSRMAEVNRTFSASLKDVGGSGYHTLVVPRLPSGVDEQSISVSGIGSKTSSAIALLSTVLVHRSATRENDDKYQDLVRTTKDLISHDVTATAQLLQAEREKLQQRMKSLNKYVEERISKPTMASESSPGSSSPSMEMTLGKISELLDFQESGISAINQQLRAVDSMLNCTQHTLSLLSRTLNDLESNGHYKSPLLELAKVPMVRAELMGPATTSSTSTSSAVTEAADILQQVHNKLKQLPLEDKTWPQLKIDTDLHVNIHVSDPTSTSTSSSIEAEGELQFHLSYMTQPASWWAEYDVRLDNLLAPAESPSRNSDIRGSSGGGVVEGVGGGVGGGGGTGGGRYSLRLAFYAKVEQRTGEDWDQVPLRLSTAESSRSNSFCPRPRQTQVRFFERQRMHEAMHMAKGAAPRTAAMHTAGLTSRARSVDGEADALFDDDDRDNEAEQFVQMDMMEDMAFEMNTMGAAASSTGDLGAAYIFSPLHPVSVRSSGSKAKTKNVKPRTAQMMASPGGAGGVGGVASTETAEIESQTRLYIDTVSTTPVVFSYVVPTMGQTAYLRAWSQYLSTQDSDAAAKIPLLSSVSARVFLQGAFSGVTTVPSTQPGGNLRLNLGNDKNVQFTSTFVLPRESSKEEDKSTWFVRDKVKYNIKTTEYAFAATNTHGSDHLVLLSEYLPHASGDQISVELLEPAPTSVVHLQRGAATSTGGVDDSSTNDKKEGKGQDVWSEEEFVQAVLSHPLLTQHPSHPQYQASSSSPSSTTTAGATTGAASGAAAAAGGITTSVMHVFVAKGSNNIVWAQWLKPQQTVRCGLKYRVVWPDGKEIRVN